MHPLLSDLTLVDILATVLGLVSLALTTLGFFAAFYFYIQGARLQTTVNSTLAQISERANHISSQASQILSKTLDAALSNTQLINADFDTLNKQLSETRNAITTGFEAIRTDASELSAIRKGLDERLLMLAQQVAATHARAVDLTQHPLRTTPSTSYEQQILTALNAAGDPIDIDALLPTLRSVEHSDLDREKVLRTLRHMSYKGLVKATNKDGVLYYESP